MTMDEEEKIIPIFEQSWEYIRHSQNMFWQSFTGLFGVIVVILLFISDKGDSKIRIIGISSSMTLSLIGFFVCSRTIRIIREHFLAINNVRSKLKIDDFADLIPRRWKRYKIEEFGKTSPETVYILIAGQLYLVVILFLVWSLAVLENYSMFSSIIGVISTLILLEYYAWTQAYKEDKKQ